MVDPNRIHTLALTFECLNSMAGRPARVCEICTVVAVQNLAPRSSPEIRRKCPDIFRTSVIKHVFGQTISEALDHGFALSKFDNNRNGPASGSRPLRGMAATVIAKARRLVAFHKDGRRCGVADGRGCRSLVESAGQGKAARVCPDWRSTATALPLTYCF